MLFNFSSSEIHSRVWKVVGTFLMDVAAKNADTFGPWLENLVNKIGEFGTAAAKLYPAKQVKVHLQ
jgi:hypothetical protein